MNWTSNINEKDIEGELTPLHLAVISGNTRVVRKLLIKGSDVNLFDKQGKTPSDLAKEIGFNNILKMLVNIYIFIFFFHMSKSVLFKFRKQRLGVPKLAI